MEHRDEAEFAPAGPTPAKRLWAKPAIEDFAPVTIARGGSDVGTGDGFSNAS